MKASGRAGESYLASPKDVSPLTLLFGANETEIRQLIQKKCRMVIGDNANEEMRFHSFEGKELVKDKSLLFDSVKSRSFFTGPVGIIIYGCVDGLNDQLNVVVNDWQQDDAYIFAQSGNLTKSSKLRKSFEASQKAMVIGIYDEPLDATKMSSLCEKHGLKLDGEAKSLLFEFGTNLETSAFEKFVEGIALYQGDQVEKLTSENILSLLPAGYTSGVDELINCILNNQPKKLVQSLRRAPAQGISNHQIISMAVWRLHALAKVKSASDPSRAMMQLRPPMFGTRRTQFENTLRKWPLFKLENALKVLSETELFIRSGIKNTPEAAFVERNLLKICFMNR